MTYDDWKLATPPEYERDEPRDPNEEEESEMEKRETTIEGRADKFGQGPWLDEPDHIEWRSAHGFVCLMHRHPSMGHWCGYVGVPPEHPWHGKDKDDVGADVHGALTRVRECSGDICHVPAEGEPEHLWWLGFDCAHSGDVSPGNVKLGGIFTPVAGYESYRGESYVRRQTEQLAEQAKSALS